MMRKFQQFFPFLTSAFSFTCKREERVETNPEIESLSDTTVRVRELVEEGTTITYKLSAEAKCAIFSENLTRYSLSLAFK